MSNTKDAAITRFSSFSNFVYDPHANLKSNFNRLATARKWGNKLRCAQWAECQVALFDTLYGTDPAKLEIWQALCREVRITEPPNSIRECKKVNGIYVLSLYLRTDVCMWCRSWEVAKFWSIS
jgi:hypothetical protein